MIRDYISIARPDHWFKNVFVLPGVLLAWMACKPEDPGWTLLRVCLALLATCLVASSNYTINEWLDASEDRHHPEKSRRPAAAGRISPFFAYLQWILLAAAGLTIAWELNLPLSIVTLLLFVQGILYNMRPFRSKERVYLDVLSESVNNPVRFLIGWYSVGCFLIPPISLIVAYWMLGGFFMAIKRLAELRHINDAVVAGAYRRSFLYYSPEKLLISIVFYSTAFGLFAGIFLIRYRMELILAIPFLAGLMAMYMHLGFMPNSPAQRPEGLYKHKAFVLYAMLTSIVLIGCLLVRLPWLNHFFETTIPSGF